MLDASFWRKPAGDVIPVAASYLHGGNHSRKLGSTGRAICALRRWRRSTRLKMSSRHTRRKHRAGALDANDAQIRARNRWWTAHARALPSRRRQDTFRASARQAAERRWHCASTDTDAGFLPWWSTRPSTGWTMPEVWTAGAKSVTRAAKAETKVAGGDWRGVGVAYRQATVRWLGHRLCLGLHCGVRPARRGAAREATERCGGDGG